MKTNTTNKKQTYIYCTIITLLLTLFINFGTAFAHEKQQIRGKRMPRLSTEQRDQLQVVDNMYAEGLVIYNTDTECIEYWNGIEWKGLCGGIAMATVKADCEDVTFHGTYIEGAPLNSEHFLTMTVNVVKAGAYGITATTDNGYGFNASGTFLNPGVQRVTLAGQGTPLHESVGDKVEIVIDGSVTGYTCSEGAGVIIPVAPASPTFTMNCVSVMVNGTYAKGVTLKPTNTITLTVNVTDLGDGRWSASTNTVDGIYFSGMGTFATTGPQTITLAGYGAPLSSSQKTMTITANSKGLATTCSAVIPSLAMRKTILAMGNVSTAPFSGRDNGTYGYAANASTSYRMIMEPKNFGTEATSTVQVQGLSMRGANSSFVQTLPGAIRTRVTANILKSGLGESPDIVIIGWGMIYDEDMIDQLINYLNEGGVMIIMNEFANSNNVNNCEASFFSKLFGTRVTARSITTATGGAISGGSSNGTLYPLASIPGDPILNGPFGNLNGLVWGGDYHPETVMVGIPESQIITYTGGNVVGGSTGTGVTMFRHVTYNLFWVGDGGFVANNDANINPTSATEMPFAVNASNQPEPRTGYGSGDAYGGSRQTVVNSQLFANVMAWAIRQAEMNGINAK